MQARFPCNPLAAAKAALVIGRCHAAAGRITEAQAVFTAAIAPARSCRAFFFEILLARDLILHVLDHEDCPDDRESQLPRLRAAVRALPGDSAALAQLLGGGLSERVLQED